MNTLCKQTFFQSLHIPSIVALVFFAAASLFFVPPAEAYEQAPALMDLRTTFSDGDYDPQSLVQMAVNKGFSVIFLNDHDRVVMEYGLPPFRNIVKKKEELNSINKSGAERYLRIIAGLRKMYPNVILIPGTESTPFYYWTGSPFTGTLKPFPFCTTVSPDPISGRRCPHSRLSFSAFLSPSTSCSGTVGGAFPGRFWPS
jgi:hypothetical protein